MHGDIKPANMMFKTPGRLYLIDFGMMTPLNEYFSLPLSHPYPYYPFEFLSYAIQFDLFDLGKLKGDFEGTKQQLLARYSHKYVKGFYHDLVSKQNFKRHFKDVIDDCVIFLLQRVNDECKTNVSENNLTELAQKLDVFSLGITIYDLYSRAREKNKVKNESFIIKKVFPILVRMTHIDPVKRITLVDALQLWSDLFFQKCKNNEYFDAKSKTCVKQSDVTLTSKCKNGEVFQPRTKQCVKIEEKTCKEDELKHPITKRCIKKNGKTTENKRCKEDEILNPFTGRCIKKNGAKAKQILEQENKGHEIKARHTTQQQTHKTCKEDEIINPVTGRCVKRDGAKAKQMLEQKGKVDEHEIKAREKGKAKDKKCKEDEIVNPVTGRCVKRNGAIGRKILAIS